MSAKIGIAVCCGMIIAGPSLSAPAFGKSRPWDVDRYAKCMEVTGRDELASTQTFSTAGCRDRIALDSNDGLDGAQISVWALGTAGKSVDGRKSIAIAYQVSQSKSITTLGGNAVSSGQASWVEFDDAFTLVNGKRTRLEIAGRRRSPPDCTAASLKGINMFSCSYSAVGAVVLTPEAADQISHQYTADPDAIIRVRLESRGLGLTFTIPVAEVEAARRAVYAGG